MMRIDRFPQYSIKFFFSYRINYSLLWCRVLTLIIAALTAAAFTAQGIYAPNKSASDNVATQGAEINATNTLIAEQLYAQGDATGNQTLLDQSEAIFNETAPYADDPFLTLTQPLATLNQSLEYYSQATTFVA